MNPAGLENTNNQPIIGRITTVNLDQRSKENNRLENALTRLETSLGKELLNLEIIRRSSDQCKITLPAGLFQDNRFDGQPMVLTGMARFQNNGQGLSRPVFLCGKQLVCLPIHSPDLYKLLTGPEKQHTHILKKA